MILYIPLLDPLHSFTRSFTSRFTLQVGTRLSIAAHLRTPEQTARPRRAAGRTLSFGRTCHSASQAPQVQLSGGSPKRTQKENPKKERKRRTKRKNSEFFQRGVLPKRKKEEISTVRLSTSALCAWTDSCALQCLTCFENTAYQDLLDIIWTMTRVLWVSMCMVVSLGHRRRFDMKSQWICSCILKTKTR